MQLLNESFVALGLTLILTTAPGALELLCVTTGALRRTRRFESQLGSNLSVAVIVPAHNEERLIGRCVQSLKDAAASVPFASIVAVADNCTDCTAERASQAGARVLVRDNPAERGKGCALRFAFEALTAESFDAFVVVDADSIVSENMLREVVGALSAGAQAVQTRYRVLRPLNTDRKRLMDVALLAFNVLRPRGRSAYGLSAGILGNGFALSRQTVMNVPYSADSIVEDLEYHLLLLQAGVRVVFVDKATVYGDMPEEEGAQVSQRARWEGGRARVARMKVGQLVGRLFRGNWLVLEPVLELLTLPLAYLFLLAVGLSAIPIGAFRAYGLILVCLMLAHVVVSTALSGDILDSMSGLVAAPAYIIWKLLNMTAIVRSSRRDTPWLRTGRSSNSKAG